MLFDYRTVQILAFFILFPAVIGLVRYKKMLPSFHPFVFFIWIGLLNEIVSIFLPLLYKSNAVNSNIYVLAEGLMLLWVFYTWTFRYTKEKKLFLITGIVFFFIWLADNVFFNSITRFNSVYRIIYSLVIVFLSVNHINRILIEERDSVIKNARFIICAGFVCFFSYRMVFEVFYLYDFNLSANFYNNLFNILIVVNLVCNLIYALALLWTPTRQRFTLPY